MKRAILITLISVLLSIHASNAYGVLEESGTVDVHTISFTVTLQPIHPITPELPPVGERQVPARLPASISTSGVEIERVSESEILSYDIYSTSGIQVGSFGSSEDFSSTLFSLEGEYEVRFTTSDYVYIGYVWME